MRGLFMDLHALEDTDRVDAAHELFAELHCSRRSASASAVTGITPAADEIQWSAGAAVAPGSLLLLWKSSGEFASAASHASYGGTGRPENLYDWPA